MTPRLFLKECRIQISIRPVKHYANVFILQQLLYLCMLDLWAHGSKIFQWQQEIMCI